MPSQRYYTAAGDDPYSAKKKAEDFRFVLDTEYMHVITLCGTVLGALVPSLVFHTTSRLNVLIVGLSVIVSIVLGLWLTKAYKRKLFVIGYSVVALPALFLIWVALTWYGHAW